MLIMEHVRSHLNWWLNRKKHSSRSPSEGTPSLANHVHRSEQDRLGGIPSRVHSTGLLGREAAETARKLAGNESSLALSGEFPSCSKRPDSNSALRQHNSGVSHKQGGGGQSLTNSVHADVAAVIVVPITNICLRAAHVAGVDNMLVDMLSRQRVLHGEWMLHRAVVQIIFRQLERLLIDRPLCQQTEQSTADFLLVDPPGGRADSGQPVH